jgi:hypothetical protein
VLPSCLGNLFFATEAGLWWPSSGMNGGENHTVTGFSQSSLGFPTLSLFHHRSVLICILLGMRQAAAVLHLPPPWVCGRLYQPQHSPPLLVCYGLCQPLLLCMPSIIIVAIIIIIIIIIIVIIFSFFTPQCRKNIVPRTILVIAVVIIIIIIIIINIIIVIIIIIVINVEIVLFSFADILRNAVLNYTVLSLKYFYHDSTGRSLQKCSFLHSVM